MSVREQELIGILIAFIGGIAATVLYFKWVTDGLTFPVATQAITIAITLVITILALVAIRTQIYLHQQTQRPTVQCDLVCVYETAYLRIKNFGPVAVLNISLIVDSAPADPTLDFAELPPFKHGVSLLTPQAELFYFVLGPGAIPHERWAIRTEYKDPTGKRFSDDFVLNTADLSRVDVGRHNNDPVVRKLDAISKALEKA